MKVLYIFLNTQLITIETFTEPEFFIEMFTLIDYDFSQSDEKWAWF